MKLYLLFIFPLLTLVISGCSTLTDFLPSVQTLTPSGGTFTSDAVITGGSSSTLTVPANAVYAPTALTFSVVTSVPSPPNNATLLAAYSFSATSATSFLLPATLQITYGANSVFATNYSSIQLYLLNNGSWQLLNGTTLNAANFSITNSNVITLGTYAVFAS